MKKQLLLFFTMLMCSTSLFLLNAKKHKSREQLIPISKSDFDKGPVIYRYCKHAFEAINSFWRPPIDAQKGTTCSVIYHINNKGRVDHAEYIKRSNIIIYDLSIMRIEKQLTFHPKLWGKTFKNVDFTQ